MEKIFRAQILDQLTNYGPVAAATGKYLQDRNVNFKFRKLKYSAAAWTWSGSIQLNDKFESSMGLLPDPNLLSLVIHETRHLQQGPFKALSVFGELDAWQVGFNFFKEWSDSPLHPILEEILCLPLIWQRTNLKMAATLMKKVSPGYKIDLLPLYPLPAEILWWLTRRTPVHS